MRIAITIVILLAGCLSTPQEEVAQHFPLNDPVDFEETGPGLEETGPLASIKPITPAYYLLPLAATAEGTTVGFEIPDLEMFRVDDGIRVRVLAFFDPNDISTFLTLDSQGQLLSGGSKEFLVEEMNGVTSTKGPQQPIGSSSGGKADEMVEPLRIMAGIAGTGNGYIALAPHNDTLLAAPDQDLPWLERTTAYLNGLGSPAIVPESHLVRSVGVHHVKFAGDYQIGESSSHIIRSYTYNANFAEQLNGQIGDNYVSTNVSAPRFTGAVRGNWEFHSTSLDRVRSEGHFLDVNWSRDGFQTSMLDNFGRHSSHMQFMGSGDIAAELQVSPLTPYPEFDIELEFYALGIPDDFMTLDRVSYGFESDYVPLDYA